MLEGEVRAWFNAKGYGFLQRLDGERPDVFRHATQLIQGAESLPVGQRVRFDLASNIRNGKTHAVNVKMI
jgi:cold shock CspA family protein